MSFLTLLAAGCLPTLILGAPLQSSLSQRAAAVSYVQYTGSGASSSGWPAQSSWKSFDSLFSDSESIIKGSCTQFNVANPSDSEVSDIKSGIQTVASESGIPAQFILAVLMQESNGCVRAPTTNYGVRNPGLMQDHDGSATCNDGGSVQNPCPADTITQMIRDGVEGTSQGDGLKQCIAQAGTNDVSKYYRAARIYNSGSVSGNDLSAGVATHCYASDIANRLTGWSTAPHDCNLDGADVPVNTVAPVQSSEPTSSAAPASSSTPVYTPPVSTPATTAAPTTLATTTSSKSAFSGIPTFNSDNAPAAIYTAPADNGAKAAAEPTVTKAATSSSSSTPAATSSAAAAPASSSSSDAPLGPGVSASCPQLYTVVDGDSCWTLGQTYKFTMAQFQSWNPSVDATCSNLWKGYQYCVKGS